VRTAIETITPEIAAEMLKQNVGNRTLRKWHVSRLSATIARGDWLVTHQGIAIATDGRILDGQHRLAAIVAANKTVSMMVARDCDPSTFIVLDQGAKRSYGDALRKPLSEVAALRWAYGFSKSTDPIYAAKMCTISELSAVHEWFGPPLERVTNYCSSTVKQRTTSGIIFAVALRVAMGQGATVLPLWRAYVLLDIPNIPPSVATLLKRLDNGTINHRTDGVMVVANAFRAFDPDRLDVPLGSIRNEDLAVEEIRAEVGRVIDRWRLQNTT
jgi:hypothetical protein